ncbi:MAG: energy-coupling factor transporter transmembrane protein EcfT [Ruminococcaceae bacterium]|nr:energy-coupling factor transporter transmembrane protein EcfT [Oscillospiraceae bacterium]
MIKNFTLGQYFNTASVIHKMDPRFKIIQIITLIVFLFLAPNFIGIGILAIAIIFILLISKVPLKMYLRNLKPIIAIIILTALLNIFYVTGGTVLVSWWIFTITTEGLLKAAFMATRIILMILISSVLTYTTTPTELTDAIESLLSPLKFIGLGEAVHTLAMMMTIALRFIPTLTDETDKIMSAQKARGADMESGGIFKRLRALMPILIPLLFSSVRRAYELAEAMDCRCYTGGKGRTRMKKLSPSLKDFVALFITIVICTSIILLRIF